MAGLRSTGRVVFVLEYQHKHGSDTTVYDSDRALYAAAKSIMEQYIDDFDHNEKMQKQVRKAIEEGRITEAMDMWGELTGQTEYLNSNEETVWTLNTAIDVMREATDAGGTEGE